MNDIIQNEIKKFKDFVNGWVGSKGFWLQEKMDEYLTDAFTRTHSALLAEKIKEIEALAIRFPVRESDEFDQGRESMQREVLEILKK